MPTLVKIRGLARAQAAAGDGSVMKGRGVRLPSVYTAYNGAGSVKATLSMTANTVQYAAVAGGTWANALLITHVVGGSAPSVAVTYASGTGVPTITVTAPATATLAANLLVVAAVNNDPVAGQFVVCSILGTGATAHTAGGPTALGGTVSGANDTSGGGYPLLIRAVQNGTIVVDVDNAKTARTLRRSDWNFVSLGVA